MPHVFLKSRIFAVGLFAVSMLFWGQTALAWVGVHGNAIYTKPPQWCEFDKYDWVRLYHADRTPTPYWRYFSEASPHHYHMAPIYDLQPGDYLLRVVDVSELNVTWYEVTLVNNQVVTKDVYPCATDHPTGGDE